jgi:fungal STAND N-terminal Goodbye domain
MSATTSTTTSPSNFRLIIDAALDEYTKQTGMDLTQDPFAYKLQHSDSPHRVVGLFQDRANQFKEYRDGNRKLINFLKPVVEVLHALSGTLGEAISLVCALSFSHVVV